MRPTPIIPKTINADLSASQVDISDFTFNNLEEQKPIPIKSEVVGVNKIQLNILKYRSIIKLRS